jgi:hypothetical protein
MVKIICNHCEASADFDEKYQGKIKHIEEQTGMIIIPKRPHLSFGLKSYCSECVELIAERKLKRSAKAVPDEKP